MLKGMREMFSNGFDVLSRANDCRDRVVDKLHERINADFKRVGAALLETWDYLGYLGAMMRSTYGAAFPGRNAALRDEIAQVIRRPKSN
jgi:hypothetical protein